MNIDRAWNARPGIDTDGNEALDLLGVTINAADAVTIGTDVVIGP